MKKPKTITCYIGNETTLMLENVIEVYGHDDSLPFNADVYIHNPNWCECLTFVGRAWNDGWGGESNIDCNTERQRDLVNKLNDHLKENYQMNFGNMNWEIKLVELIDYVVCRALADYRRMKITDIDGVAKKAA